MLRESLQQTLDYHLASERSIQLKEEGQDSQDAKVIQVDESGIELSVSRPVRTRLIGVNIFSFQSVYTFETSVLQQGASQIKLAWPEKLKSQDRRRSPRLPFDGHLAPLFIQMGPDEDFLEAKAVDLSATGFQVQCDAFQLDEKVPFKFLLQEQTYSGEAQLLRKSKSGSCFNFTRMDQGEKLGLNRLIQRLIEQLQENVIQTANKMARTRALLKKDLDHNSESFREAVKCLAELIDPIFSALADTIEREVDLVLHKKNINVQRVNRGLFEVFFPFLFKAPPLQGMVLVGLTHKFSHAISGSDDIEFWAKLQKRWAELAHSRLQIGPFFQGLHLLPLLPKVGLVKCLSVFGKETFLRIPFDSKHGHVDFYASITGLTNLFPSNMTDQERSFLFNQDILQAVYASIKETMFELFHAEVELRGVEFKPNLQPKFENGALLPCEARRLSARLFLNASHKFSQKLQEILLGETGDISPDLPDAFGEVLNMIGGRAKQHISKMDELYRVGIPSGATSREDLVNLSGQNAYLAFVFTSPLGPFECCISLRINVNKL